uniref:Uncharacterized protein n=1 Tax=Anguilla anguilla TaxID=7936 RepID=A0A0E9R3J0_ANGAN
MSFFLISQPHKGILYFLWHNSVHVDKYQYQTLKVIKSLESRLDQENSYKCTKEAIEHLTNHKQL